MAILGWSRPAHAQHLTLLFQDGHVTVDAQDVSLSTILAEWSRIGGTTVISAERITDARATLALAAVPESEALDILPAVVRIPHRPAGQSRTRRCGV